MGPLQCWVGIAGLLWTLAQGYCKEVATRQMSFSCATVMLKGWVKWLGLSLICRWDWQETDNAGALHRHCADFPSSEPKHKALLVTGAWSHTAQLRFEMLFSSEDSANEGMTTAWNWWSWWYEEQPLILPSAEWANRSTSKERKCTLNQFLCCCKAQIQFDFFSPLQHFACC